MNKETVYRQDYRTVESFIEALKVKEHTLYKVLVKTSNTNVAHESFLFVGFDTGGYCTLYNNSYEYPIDLSDVWSVKLLKKLSNL